MIEQHWQCILPAEASCRTTKLTCCTVDNSPAHGHLGEPLWPAGQIGSITHAAGLRTEAMASSRHIAALGIDMERRQALAPATWSRMLAPDEVSALLTLPAPQRGLAALEIWCLKEALFKALLGTIQLEELCLCRDADHWRPALSLCERLCRSGLAAEQLIMRSFATDGWQLAAVWQYRAT